MRIQRARARFWNWQWFSSSKTDLISLARAALLIFAVVAGVSSAQQPTPDEFPLDRTRAWLMTFPDARGTVDTYRLTFTDRPVNVFPELVGTQAVAERGAVSRYVTSVLYLRAERVLLLSLFVRMPLLAYEPAINCALRLTPDGWQGEGRLERVSEFVRKLRDGQLNDTSPCALTLAD